MSVEQSKAFPLAWPHGRARSSSRRRSAFQIRGQAGRAIQEVVDEVQRLGAARPTLSTNLRLGKSGLPLADSPTPADPGAAVYFDLKGTEYVLACDQWLTVAENLWSIARTIEAMRAIKRWGSGEMLMQAFSGFKALPPGTPLPMSWRSILGFAPDYNPTLGEVTERHRSMALQLHPDQGGDGEQMARLNGARVDAEREMGV